MATPFYATLPFRKVVEVTTDRSGYPQEILECGHRNTPPMNPYTGMRPAKRRRCSTCMIPFQPTPPICPECFHARRWDELGGGSRDAVCDHCGRRGAWDA
jgi:hypothetical protein